MTHVSFYLSDEQPTHPRTFGGEFWIEDKKYEDYGISIGELSIGELSANDLKSLARSMIPHLHTNGHVLTVVKTEFGQVEVKFNTDEAHDE